MIHSNPTHPFTKDSAITNNTNPKQPNAFQIVVNTTDPMFVYCGFPLHCKNGMSAVINPGNDTTQTLEAYRLASAEVRDAVVPREVFGGQVVASSGNTPPPGRSLASSQHVAVSMAVPVVGALIAVALMR